MIGDSNESLVNNLAGKSIHLFYDSILIRFILAQGIIRSERVIRAMKSVDRGHYSPIAPYADCPQSIGYNVTISAP
jgi:protein-L-isoaspartate O-methyltransferase